MLYPAIRFTIGASCAFGGALLLLLGHAQAEEPRYVPQAGASLTYKTIMITNVRPDLSVTTGWTHVYRIKSSDDLISEGTMELTSVYAASPTCPGQACDNFKRDIEQLNARKEGDLYAVSVPSDVTRELAKLSAIRLRYFVRELEDSPVPNTKTDSGATGFDLAPLFVGSTKIECDKALLQSFFPIGKLPRLSVPCTYSFERTHVHPPMKEVPPQKHDITLEISYEGQSKVTTAPGEWAVQNIRIVSTPRDGSQATSESLLLFSEQIGAIVKSHSTNKVGNSGVSNQVDRELVAVSR
jgi:hypothetical protein